MLNFTYEDNIKIKNKLVAGVSRTFYLFTETISRPPQSRETIPLKIDQLGAVGKFTMKMLILIHEFSNKKNLLYIPKSKRYKVCL
jgi:hypothetical protein